MAAFLFKLAWELSLIKFYLLSAGKIVDFWLCLLEIVSESNNNFNGFFFIDFH